MLRNEAEAEDAAQETVIKVYRNLHMFRGDSQFRTWVLSIARNEGLGRLRKAETRREDSLDALTDDQAGDYTPAILTSWREVPAEALERKELGALLRKAIEGLPEIYRNVVLLRDIEEMDVRETAAALGITEGAVKVRLHRARALLQRGLAPKLKGFAPQTEASCLGGRNEDRLQTRLGTHLRLHRRRSGRGPARRNRRPSGNLRDLLGRPRLHAQCGRAGGRRSRL